MAVAVSEKKSKSSTQNRLSKVTIRVNRCSKTYVTFHCSIFSEGGRHFSRERQILISTNSFILFVIITKDQKSPLSNKRRLRIIHCPLIRHGQQLIVDVQRELSALY